METPLAHSYYNYSYDPNSTYYQNYDPSYLQVQPPVPGQFEDPIKQTIYNALTVKEKPKNHSKNIFQQAVPDLLDESLPKELKLLFQPLYCKLCLAQLSSKQTAKMHYKSKNHEKKMKRWLVEWSESTGEPLHQRALAGNDKKSEDSQKNPAWFHCDVCDLELTGRLHAESHYMGKNHQNALMGHKKPSGPGYYDTEGRWVRVKSSKSNPEDDTFGEDFRKRPPGPDLSSLPAKKLKVAQFSSKFHCDVCFINTTCQEQLDNHFRGQKHLKKLKQLGIDPLAGGKTPTESLDPHCDQEVNLAVYRTPSGDYYCPSCNTTTNSELQFVQHLRSKGHAKKVTQKVK
ncbi:hypothetical protein ABEB36_006598 [Hypothenemus hampei]